MNRALDDDTYRPHLAITTKRSVLGGDAACRYGYCTTVALVLFLLGNTFIGILVENLLDPTGL